MNAPAQSLAAPAANSSTSPRVAVILKIDTLGDLVLFAPTLRALRAAWPKTRLVVVIRRAYLDLAPLIAADVQWLATPLDPFGNGPDADPAELTRLREAIAALQPEIVAAASSRRHWLDVALAAAAPEPGSPNGPKTGARRISLGAATDDTFFAAQLQIRLELRAGEVFSETIPAPADEADWQRNLRLADMLIGREVPRTPPALTLDAATRSAAEKILAAHKLTPGKFAACAAAGFANVGIKTWPAEKFGAALQHLRTRHHLPALLIGHESERAHLESVRAALLGQVSDLPSPTARAEGRVTDPPYPQADGHPYGAPALWLGRDGELPLLAALIAESALYFGNDTGAMHLAAALEVPVVAMFGGGTWPRFIPAARQGVAVVQPLPCFGCGWDCAFGNAPCLGGITVADATDALDFALGPAGKNSFTVKSVAHIAPEVRDLMGRAAARYRAMGVEHAIRQRKLEEKDVAILEKEASIFEKEAAIAEKEKEIDALKTVCNERERVIFVLDGNVKALQAELAKGLAVPASTAASTAPENAIAALRAELAARDAEIASIRSALAERDASLKRHNDGLTQLDQAQYLIRQLHEKERMLQILNRVCAERETLIRKLTAESTEPTAHLRRLGIALDGWWRAKISVPLRHWLERKILDGYWMQIGILKQYEPRPLKWDPRMPRRQLPAHRLPRIGLVTPSYNQAQFLGSTMTNVFRQNYPHLLYVVQDGGSTDGSVDIIQREAARLHHWESARDAGQADAIRKGFTHVAGSLAPNDIMAWLNSDDLLAPRALHAVARYFVKHPDVDVVYGHRIIIDNADRDIARWIMPPHENAALEWIDYVPQETLFWRKRAWDRVGGLDPTFQFALDWDLIARFQQAGLKLVRLPWFLGAFRVHVAQKTSQQIHTLGHEEMNRIRAYLHGGAVNIDPQKIEFYAHKTRVEGAFYARLAGLGIRL